MERRTHNRFPIRLDAIVHDKMFHSWPYVIEDFGFDGLFLRWPNRTKMPDSIKVNDLLDVKISIDHVDQANEYHIEVKVVRLLEEGLAVSLFIPAIDAMIALSRQQQRAGEFNPTLESALDKKSNNILLAISQSFQKDLSHSTEIFLPIVHDAMFQRAEKSTNNSEQTLYFDAINTLNKSKDKLKHKFLELLQAKLQQCHQDHFFNRDTSIQDDHISELDLIDQNEFENWLAVNQLIVNVSPRYEQELLEIKLRLAHLFSIDPNTIEVTPFSPEMIFKCFSEAIHEYFLSNDILLILYYQFEKIMDNHLFDIYKRINQIFIDYNILPLIEKNKLKIVKETSKPQKSAENEKEVKQLLQQQSQQQPINRQVEDVTAQPSTNGAQSQSSNIHNAQNSSQHLTEINTLQNKVDLEPTFQTLKELLTFNNGQEYEKISEEFIASGQYQQQLSELVNELTLLQNKQAKQINNNEQIPDIAYDDIKKHLSINRYSKELINEFKYTFDIIKRLFNSISQDLWLGQPVKDLLALLQIPILKVALLHKDFFESWSNPARIVVNKLAMVDFDNEKNTFFIKAKSFVLYLLKHYEQDLEIFSKVQVILTQLLEIQTKHYNKNIEQIISGWNAQQTVINELATRLSGRKIPLVVADFISYQWLPILVLTYSTKGKDSSQWSQYLQALDMLLLTLSGDVSDDFIDRDVILFIIRQGFDDNKQFNTKIIDELENFLIKGDDKSTGVVLDLQEIIKLLINGYALSNKAALLKINKGVTDATAHSNKAIAKRLSINDYVVLNQNNKSSRLQFVWGSDNQNVFVFAARTGQQAAVFNLMEIVSMLDNGMLSQTKDYDLPLLERSLYNILGDVHDDMALQCHLDSITGFIGRKEFERLFTQLLTSKNKDKTQCALCLIDIDNFRLINDTCSYEAGDMYLKDIAQAISEHLPEQAIIARYGINEFALYLSNHTEAQARAVAEIQRKIVSGHSFCWEEKEFTLSASIGLVIVPEYNEPALFLKALYTATTIAKELGRNRVHVLEYDALELNHRQELQVWATKVDKMIKNNQLDVRGHRLHPILDESLNPHYEMLLLVKDEQGHNMPPAEFIEAAELYNKMADVDRWVINYVLQWYSSQPQLLEKLGGVAINLSGHSLNDVDFLSFIQEAFERYSVPPQRICFEITETVAIINMNHAINVIHSIKEIGCEFSLDDFGTGQSSYAYLKNLPVDYLKIDGIFIKDIVNNPADQAMVKSINEIGHFLGMKTVAEYVENDEIITILKDIGVDYAQGYGVEMPALIKDQDSALINVQAN